VFEEMASGQPLLVLPVKPISAAGHLGALRRVPLLHRFASPPEPSAPDPVSLAVFALNVVGPAAIRACACGVEVRVAAPDEATAAVFRAALAETARRRATDGLVRIVVG
jgi:hypothetical protein